MSITILTFVLLLAKPSAFGEGEFDNFRAAYVYFVVVLNISQLWAMYCLVFMYQYALGRDEYTTLLPCVTLTVFPCTLEFQRAGFGDESYKTSCKIPFDQGYRLSDFLVR